MIQILEISGRKIKAAVTSMPNEVKENMAEMNKTVGNLNGEVNIYN